MNSPYIRSRRLHLLSLLIGGATILVSSAAWAEEPEWRTPWQKQLVGWLKTVEQKDVTIEEKVFNFETLDSAEELRNIHLVHGYAGVLKGAKAALVLTDQSFVWKELWDDEAAIPTVLQPYRTPKGNFRIPSAPTTANLLAWLYNWDRPWNPYYRDANVARRAAIISIIDMIMLHEDDYYYTAGEPGCRLPPFKPQACKNGFSLTFNAYTYLQVKDALPKEVLDAWGEGLRWMADMLFAAPASGPENMQLSVPVGIYYTGLALDAPVFLENAEISLNRLLDKHWSPAGYIRDAGVPDGSYNGISLHRLGEYWGMTRSERVLEALKTAYELKAHLVLPEPDGSSLSPSHFNARCRDGFDADQYPGREVIFLEEIPAASYFAQKTLRQPSSPDFIARRAAQPFTRLAQPTPWVANRRWDMVMELPYLLYHGKNQDRMREIIDKETQPPVLREERYTKNFGNEFYCIRRPNYAAIFYAGPAVETDNGATNLGGDLKPDGGHLMGFGGGGISAFWTPECSSVILGRLTASEGYERKTRSLKWGDYLIGGWRDWLNNQVVGETEAGKVLSTSRVKRPQSLLSEDGSRLVIKGVIPRKLRLQGDITDVNVSYERTYQFDDEGIDCVLEIDVNKTLVMKSLYESLPILMQQVNKRTKEPVAPLTWQFLDGDGKVLDASGGRLLGVKTILLHRNGGSSSVIFEQPANLSLETATLSSSQLTHVNGRAILIELPTRLEPGEPVRLRYRLEASKPKQG